MGFIQDNEGGFMTKKEMRKFAKELRKEKNLKEISEKICAHVSQLEEFQQAKNVMLYSPLAHEIDVFCLLSHAKNWLLPKIEDDIIIPYFYHPDDEGGLLWSDPEIGINWPIPEDMELTLSDKDQKWGGIKDYKK